MKCSYPCLQSSLWTGAFCPWFGWRMLLKHKLLLVLFPFKNQSFSRNAKWCIMFHINKFRKANRFCNANDMQAKWLELKSQNRIAASTIQNKGRKRHTQMWVPSHWWEHTGKGAELFTAVLEGWAVRVDSMSSKLLGKHGIKSGFKGCQVSDF